MARLRAAAKRMALTVIEMCGKDETYEWDIVNGADGFRRVTVFPDGDSRKQPRARVVRELEKVLNDVKPDILAFPSWGETHALAALSWSLRTGTPNLIMNESNQYDRRRWFPAEAVKRRIVEHAQAALVGGEDSKAYHEALGMESDRIFLGYDVVDNAHFQVGADTARRNADSLMGRFLLPPHYFLCSARLVEKKNLPRLISAFDIYQRTVGDQAWACVILGDGELRAQLERQRDRLGLERQVLMPGFKQYADLPAYYGLAGAFVLPSTEEQWGLVVNEAMASGLPVLVSNRCGCAKTLVKEGVNGYVFDPHDEEGLAQLLARLSGGEVDLNAMGRASREIISHYVPETFAENLVKAAECALSLPKPRVGLLDRALLWALIRAR